MADAKHPAARAIRAARAYSGMSRAQLGEQVGVSDTTMGRWERGQWEDDPPRRPMIEAIGRVTGFLEFVEDVARDSEPDAATRFAVVARREAQRRNGHHSAGPADHTVEGAGGGAS